MCDKDYLTCLVWFYQIRLYGTEVLMPLILRDGDDEMKK